MGRRCSICQDLTEQDLREQEPEPAGAGEDADPKGRSAARGHGLAAGSRAAIVKATLKT